MRLPALICAAFVGQVFLSQASAATLDETILAAEQDLVCAVAVEFVLANQASETGKPFSPMMLNVPLLMRVSALNRVRELPQSQRDEAHERLEALRQELMMTVAALVTSDDPIAVFQSQLEDKVSNCSGFGR